MFMAALILATAASSRAKTPPMDTPIFPGPAYLIEARVIHVDKKTLDADLVIERVYVGDNALKGRKFTISFPEGFPWFGTMHGHPSPEPLVIGEVGLWWVWRRDAEPDESKDESKLIPCVDVASWRPSIYFPFSAILSGAPIPAEIAPVHGYGDLDVDPYDFGPRRMLEWANAIKKIYDTKGDDQRIALLKKYAGSDNPPLSAWALNTLSRFLEPEAKSQLFEEGELRRDAEWLIEHDLAKRVRKDVKSILEDYADDPKLPIYAQTELDRVLTRIDDDWPKSDRRAKMLKRWEKVKVPVDRYFIKDQLKQDASK
jgi:hypothetical protein